SAVYSLHELKNGNIFVVGDYSTYLFDRSIEEFRTLDFEFGASGKRVKVGGIAENSKGDIWIATEHSGIYRWSTSSQESLELELEPSDALAKGTFNALNSIQVDAMDFLWVSSQTGLLKFNPEGVFLQRFLPEDGLQGHDFELGSSHKGQDGALYFPGVHGYNKFHPSQVEIDTTPPRTVLSAVHYPSMSFLHIPAPQQDARFEVTHKDYFITFDFAVSDFVGFQENQFRYMLEGFDPQWRENGFRSSATYTNLPSGDYTLKVQGANAAGIWDPIGLSVSVTVLPPPWRSWWAYSLYALALALAVWTALRAYQSYAIERRAREVAREMNETLEYAEAEIQEQLEFQDELLKAAYDHKQETLKLVGAIQNAADPEFSTTSSLQTPGAISALSTLEDCTYYAADGPSANLHEFAETVLRQSIERTQVNPESIITINELPDALIPAPTCSILAVVLRELLDNCVEHAFEPGSPANYIHLKLREAEDAGSGLNVFHLTVGDSGTGAPEDLFHNPPPETGAAVVCSVLSAFGGKIVLSNTSGTQITASLPEFRPPG
ncbi:MAG: triple tyrosine motif-containing protein, partial [Halioglobus sp.]|nr:triple tyrosine motif-containing protein [Halioglobus sp.]